MSRSSRSTNGRRRPELPASFFEEEAAWEDAVDLEDELDEVTRDLEDDGEPEAQDLETDNESELDIGDEVEVDDEEEWEASTDDEWEYSDDEDAGVISAGSVTIEKVALLEKHGGIGPDLVIAWNDMRGKPASVDVVIHLHGYALSKGSRLHIVRDVKARSGLDWSDPQGKDSSPGRTRPTLGLLPRGHFFGGKGDRGYSFPALVAQGGLEQLCEFGLRQLATTLGLGRLTARRVILTAHSGGGAALLKILRTADPHEVHVFDGLYQNAEALTTWAKARIDRDRQALEGGAATEEYMAEEGGALRVLYRSGTAQHSRPVATELRRAIPDGSALRRWYRVERTSTGHMQIPPVFGWRLLANVAADLPSVPFVPRTRRPQAGSKEVFEYEAPTGKCKSEPPTAAPPPASELADWPEYKPETNKFMRQVYTRAVERQKTKRFVPSVPKEQLGEVEDGQCMRIPAAERCRALLADAWAALKREKEQTPPVPAAHRVKRFGVTSGYRSVGRQFVLWRKYFRNYYKETSAHRETLENGRHGPAAVKYLAHYIGDLIAAPGYSNHNAGLAMDFFTDEGAGRLSASKDQRAAWKRSWFFKWLTGNASRYRFRLNPHIDEPWHWEYEGPGIDGSEDATTTSTATPSEPSTVTPAPAPFTSQPSAPSGGAVLAAMPRRLADAVRGGAITLAVGLAILTGQRDPNALTNMLFYARHPELPFGYKIGAHERGLGREWASIKERTIMPLLRVLNTGGATGVSSSPTIGTPIATPALPSAGIEQILATLGYRTDDITRAVREFQSDSNLKVTGALDGRTEGEIRARASKLSAAPSRPSAFRRLSRFRLTRYYVAEEDDYEGNATIPVLDTKGNILAKVSPAFFLSMSVEGTGRLRDGRLLNVSGSKHRRTVAAYPEYQKLLDVAREKYSSRIRETRIDATGVNLKDKKVHSVLAFHFVKDDARGVGYGSSKGIAHKPFLTLAADIGAYSVEKSKTPSDERFFGTGGLVPRGTRVFILELAGVRLPDGTTHDGWCTVNDTGSKIFGAHFDVFTGRQKWPKDDVGLPPVGHIWFDGSEERCPPEYTYGLKP